MVSRFAIWREVLFRLETCMRDGVVRIGGLLKQDPRSMDHWTLYISGFRPNACLSEEAPQTPCFTLGYAVIHSILIV